MLSVLGRLELNLPSTPVNPQFSQAGTPLSESYESLDLLSKGGFRDSERRSDLTEVTQPGRLAELGGFLVRI